MLLENFSPTNALAYFTTGSVTKKKTLYYIDARTDAPEAKIDEPVASVNEPETEAETARTEAPEAKNDDQVSML